jgi:hypothetical protein
MTARMSRNHRGIRALGPVHRTPGNSTRARNPAPDLMMWRVTIHRSDVRSDGCVRHTDAAARLPGHSARQRLDLMREQHLEPRRARTHTRAALREVDAAGSDLDGAGRKAGPAQQHAIGPMRDAVHNHRGNVESKPERKHRATVARARRRGGGADAWPARRAQNAPCSWACHVSRLALGLGTDGRVWHAEGDAAGPHRQPNRRHRRGPGRPERGRSRRRRSVVLPAAVQAANAGSQDSRALSSPSGREHSIYAPVGRQAVRWATRNDGMRGGLRGEPQVEPTGVNSAGSGTSDRNHDCPLLRRTQSLQDLGLRHGGRGGVVRSVGSHTGVTSVIARTKPVRTP